MVCPDSLERLETYPWYKQAGSYHISTDEADMTIASAVLKNNLAAKGIELLTLRSSCLENDGQREKQSQHSFYCHLTANKESF
jgi:hypothetical protein